MLSSEQLSRVRYLLSDEWVSDTDSPDDEEISMRRFNEVLEQMGPEELHHFAMNFNWDCGVDELRSVLRHPNCDRGTALMLYWLAAPGWFYQYESREDVPEYSLDRYEFLREIETKYLANGFAQETIRFDPTNFRKRDYTTQYKAQGGVKRVPAAFFVPTRGEEIESIQF